MESQQRTNEEKIQAHFTRFDENACSYCGIKDKPNLIKCLVCDRHFCNNKINKHFQSDIILHLSNSGHARITPNKNMWRGNKPVACFECEEKNIYKLFHFIIEGDGDYICCSKCAGGYGKDTYDLDPIIQEKKLPSWLAGSSSEELLQEAAELSHKQIAYIENCWRRKNDPKAFDIIKLGQRTEQPKLNKINTNFISGNEYLDVFLPILNIEEECDRKTKGSWFQDNVSILWKETRQNVFAQLLSPEDTYFIIRLSPGERLRVTGKYDKKFEGVIKSAKEHEIILLLEEEKPRDFGGLVKVEYVWTNITFQRMENGLVEFAINGLSNPRLNDWILNPPDNELPELQEEAIPNQDDSLNKYQNMAVEKALGEDTIVLIQGPPGTGKTVTLTAILQELITRLSHEDNKILVCAPSNIAVDHLAERLMTKNINVSRMYSRSKEFLGEVPRYLEKVSLHEEIRKLKDRKFQRLIKYINLKRDGVWLKDSEEREFKQLRLKAELKILGKAKVVCCTCITAADPRIQELFKDGYDFEYVVIDEAAHSLEPETLLPLLYNARKVILAGDHKQLGPLVKSKQGLACNFGQSLFERLAPQIKPILLLQQYRMHPSIAKFPSEKFYSNLLITGDNLRTIKHPNFPWPANNDPNFFYHVEGKEEVPSLKESYFNRREAGKIRLIVLALKDSLVRPEEIAILTPYHGQKAYLQDLQDKREIDKSVEIESIDGFQGREKNYIIISCVRSNEELGLGFLNDQRRLNVALTRAKYGLIICGNAPVLARNSLWKDLMIQYRNKGSLVCGEIGDWSDSVPPFR